MLERNVIEAVASGLFHIHSVEHTSEGIELLTGVPAGIVGGTGSYPAGSVLGLVQSTLHAYRRACQLRDHQKEGKRHLR